MLVVGLLVGAWACSTPPVVEADSAPVAQPEPGELAVYDARDAEILRLTRSRLLDPGRWDPNCDGSLKPNSTALSLYAALRQTSLEQPGQGSLPCSALARVRGTIRQISPAESSMDPLVEFNNCRTHDEVLAVLELTSDALAQAGFLRGERAGLPPAFEEMRSNAEIILRMHELARRWPDWIRCGSLGRSALGQPIPYLHLRDWSTTHPRTGVWIDGGIHGYETASSEVVLGLAETLEDALLAGTPPQCLRELDLYLIPVLNLDGRAFCMRPPYPILRSNLRPVDRDQDGRFDEEDFVDLNGDGRITTFNPDGSGLVFESSDHDGDGQHGEDLPGGVDLNRNFPVATRDRPLDWSPEEETRAVIDFWSEHPGIELAISYHTSADMFIGPTGSRSAEQRAAFERFSEHYLTHFDGITWSIAEEPQRFGIARPIGGMNIEWFQEVHSATAFVIEIGSKITSEEREERVNEAFELLDGRTAWAPRVTRGYGRPIETRLEANLAEVRTLHARYLLEVLELQRARDPRAH